MKHLLASILLFITINCFAINQELVDGAKKYDAAVANLHKIIEARDASSMPLGEFIEELHKTTDSNLSGDGRVVAKNKIDEEDKWWHELNSQYIEAEAVVKKLEPLKSEYDKQRNIENERANLIESIVVTMVIALLLITFFGSIIWLMIFQHKKYKQLLKEGKISQKEYDRIMSSRHESKSMFSNDLGVNPATGLPLIGNGVCDAGGNLRGSSSNNSFDYSQDYSSRHKWY